MNSGLSAPEDQIKEISGPLKKIWYCKQCGTIEKIEADFAKHLRSHFKGHRARSIRRAAKGFSNGIAGKSILSNGIGAESTPTSLLKFDDLSARQLEITQPNTATHLMTIDCHSGDDICERLVDPALVMPTKTTHQDLDYASADIQNDFSLTQIIDDALSEKEINLQIRDGLSTESGADMNKPLQLFYVSGDNDAKLNSDVVTDSIDIAAANNALDDIFELNPDDAFDLNDDVLQSNLNADCVSDDNVNGVSCKDDYETSLTCEICQKNFKTRAYLYRHLRKHTGEFKCDACSTTFARKETWITHRCIGKNGAVVVPAKPVEDCPSEPITPIVEPALIEPCFAASLIASAPEDFSKLGSSASKSVSDARRRAMECPTCGVMLSDASCLKRHMLTHDRAPCYTCVYCTAVVQHRHSIRRHLRLHHPEYEHEWNNRAFITSLQTEDTERRVSTSTHKRIANTIKKKIHMATKNSDASFKIPLKKDSVLGMATDLDYQVLQQPVQKRNGSVAKENSIDLSDQISSGFAVHFEDEISFPGLSDSLGKSFGNGKLKFDSKDNSPSKIFTQSFISNGFNGITDSTSCDSIKLANKTFTPFLTNGFKTIVNDIAKLPDSFVAYNFKTVNTLGNIKSTESAESLNSPDKSFTPFITNGYKTVINDSSVNAIDSFSSSFLLDSYKTAVGDSSSVGDQAKRSADPTFLPSFLKNGFKKHDVNSMKTDSALSTNNSTDFSCILDESGGNMQSLVNGEECGGGTASPEKDVGCTVREGKIMPSMPVIFCNDDKFIGSESAVAIQQDVEILVHRSMSECANEPMPMLDYTTSVLLSEDAALSSSASYNILEESSSMQVMETSNDFTFFILG